MINSLTGNKAGKKIVSQRKWDTKSRVLASIDRARDIIGYSPKIDFEEGLKSTIDWFRDNWTRIDTSADFPPGVSSAVREEISGS